MYLAFLLNQTWQGLRHLEAEVGLNKGAREVDSERITAEELTRRLNLGEACVVVDVRTRQKYSLSPVRIRGAVRLAPADVENHWQELPRDRLVVVYCDDSAEVTSLRIAQSLREEGIANVRVLRGGFDTWLRAGYPVEIKD
jgi:rhodanese-related sulfurtransferase